MPLTTLGDGATAFQLRKHNLGIRTRLNTLSNELSTGKKSDLTRALGDTTLVRDVDRRLGLAEAQGKNATEIGQRLAAMQTFLSNVDGERRALLDSVITVTSESSYAQIETAAARAEDAFAGIVGTLNTRFGGQSLFSGNATDEEPLASAKSMLDALRGVVAGSPDAATAITRIEIWFDAAGGGFETNGYISPETGEAVRRIDPATIITIEAKADAPAIRDLLKATAVAAMADDIALPSREAAEMVKDSAARLLSNAQPLTELRARLGHAEGRTEAAAARLTAQVTTLSILRNTFDTADPFETASALQEVQTQLETHYNVTARLAQLSLAGYLR